MAHVRNKRGYSLLELSVGLAVAGLVLGGIYMVASGAMANTRLQKTKNQVVTLVANIRTAYAGKPRFVVPVRGSDVMNNLFPADVTISGTGTGTVYSGALGTINLLNGNNVTDYGLTMGTDQMFAIGLSALKTDDCVRLTTDLFGSLAANDQMGFVGVGILNKGVIDTTNGVTATTALASRCNSSPTMPIAMLFHLRP